MNKLEAGDKLAQAASHLLGDNDQASPAWDEVSQALTAYRLAPAMLSPERILAAMELYSTIAKGYWHFHTDKEDWQLACQTLSELRKALGK